MFCQGFCKDLIWLILSVAIEQAEQTMVICGVLKSYFLDFVMAFLQEMFL